MNCGFEYYKPSKEVVNLIFPEVKKNFKKMRKEGYPFLDLAISGWLHSSEDIFELLKAIPFCLFGPAKKDIALGEGIYERMVSVWGNYTKKKIGDTVPLIKEKKFVPYFLADLQKNKWPKKIYKLMSKEMLEYYSANKRGDDRFDVLVSNNKKDLELLIKTQNEPYDIEKIEKEGNWIIT